MTNMTDPKKPAQAQPAPREQNPIKWLLGFAETPEEKKAREDREKRDKASRSAIDNAIKGLPVVKQVHEAAQKAKENQKK
jgi:hypothetical protein